MQFSILRFRASLVLAATLMASITFDVGVCAANDARPNVILIMPDDQGAGDFGATGNMIFETPAIDGLAKQSGSMATFYVSPVCSPTRASLMTGRYNYRTRVIDTWLGRSMMDPEETTVAELLREAGYATGIFGKWHLGDCYPMRPIDQGFEESLVHRGGGLAQPSEPRENQRRYTDPILFHNGRQVDTKGYCTDVYFRAAGKFIAKAKRDRRPFFVYLPTNAPHGPFHDVPEKLRSHYEQKPVEQLIVGARNPKQKNQEIDRLQRIGAMITNIDQNVGRLLKQLDSLELAQNTLVVFLVDNGPNTRRYVGPWRGMKSHVHDGGIRSPLWLRWPGRIKPGASSDRLSAHIDILPTILDACGVSKPVDLELDGRSLLPLLSGSKNSDWPERTIAIQSHRGDQPVRYHHFMIRNQRFKLLHASGFGRESFSGPPKFELYDLQEDPGEMTNLVGKKPAEFKRLKAAYDQWFDDVSSTRPDNYAAPRIHIGAHQERLTVLTRQDWRGGSWAKDAIGHWELFLKTPMRLQVQIEFEPSAVGESLRIRLGGEEAELPVKAGASRIQTVLEIKTSGKLTLEAALSSASKKRGVYQAMLSPVR